MEGSPPVDNEVAAALTGALRSVVSKPDVYLIKAAQLSTLKQLKAARTMLREFNGATKHQMDQQIAATDAAVQHLTSIRQDLDHAYAGIRMLKQVLAEHHPDLYQQLQALATTQD